MKDFFETRPTGLYEDAIGERNVNYYVDKFEDFDQRGPDLHASWNWAAFFGGGAWALYRKLYSWFFIWWFVATAVTVFAKSTDVRVNGILTIVIGVLWLGFSIFANSLYHLKIKARIAAAQKSNSKASRVTKRLRAGSGVLMWVPIVFGGIPIMGIVAAVALPAYQDYTKLQTVAVNTVKASVPVLDVSEFTAAPSAQNNADSSNGMLTPPPVRDQFGGTLVNEPTSQPPMSDKAERRPWEEYQYQDAVKAIDARDYVRAANLLRPLAVSGHASAQGNLGVMYNHGDGVVKDYVEAVRWYRLAAAQGNANAQSNLGLMYTLGQGVAKDYVHGHMWLNLASASGNLNAVKGRDAASVLITPQQISQAQQMARVCQQRNFKGCD